MIKPGDSPHSLVFLLPFSIKIGSSLPLAIVSPKNLPTCRIFPYLEGKSEQVQYGDDWVHVVQFRIRLKNELMESPLKTETACGFVLFFYNFC